jgi:hypothetical protein
MDGPDKGKISDVKYVQVKGAFVALEGENLKVSLSPGMRAAACRSALRGELMG